MGKDRFEFARIASPEEIAEYLTSLASGLKRGHVSLESGSRKLDLTPLSEIRIQLRVKEKSEERGKIEVELGWKRSGSAKATDLRVAVPSRRTGSERDD